MKTLKPKFSIIMPCYNSEDYVKTALESIINQSYDSWELIAINDGSTDSTLSILESYASTDNRIRIFSKENGGYVSAVNFGLDKISGEYFLFLGSDDYLSIDLLKSIFLEIEKNDCLPDCIAFKTLKLFSDNKSELDTSTSFSTTKLFPNTNFNQFSQYPSYSTIFYTRDTSKCFKTSLLGDLRYFGKFGIDADGIFTMLFCHRATSFLNVNHIGYYWSIRENSLSANYNNYTIEKQFDRLLNWTKFYNYLFINNYELLNIEKVYFRIVLKLIIDLTKNYKFTIKNKREIKTCAKQIIKFSKFFNIYNNVGSSIKLLSFSPFLYTIVNKLFLKKK